MLRLNIKNGLRKAYGFLHSNTTNVKVKQEPANPLFVSLSKIQIQPMLRLNSSGSDCSPEMEQIQIQPMLRLNVQRTRFLYQRETIQIQPMLRLNILMYHDILANKSIQIQPMLRLNL